MSTTVAILGFWLSAVALIVTCIGYPFLIAFLAQTRRRRAELADPTEWPFVSVVLVARNEGARIAARLRNLAESDYPSDRIEFVVVSDGATDETRDAVTSVGDERARLIEQTEQRGKSAGLNVGISVARGDVIVFADARQTFDQSAVRELTRELMAPGVGAVSGGLEIAASERGAGKGVDVYWKLERRLRKAEADVDSCIGCTGAIYAIRRELFTPLPEDTILDDVIIPMQIALRGQRVAFTNRARAFDPQELDPTNEARRKRRTLAGNFQMLFRYPAWLLPWRNRLWWHLIAHKYLRVFMPLFLIMSAVANAVLLSAPFYKVTAALQFAFYAFAAVGIVSRARLFAIPAGFVFLNYQVICGFAEYVTGRSRRGWANGSTH